MIDWSRLQPGDWVALLAVCATVAIALVTGAANAFSNWRRADAESWGRLIELAKTLHAGVEFGYWAQIIAVHELSTHRLRRKEALDILRSAREHWQASDRPRLKEAIEKAISKLDRRASGTP